MKTALQLWSFFFVTFVLGSCSKEFVLEDDTIAIENLVDMEQEMFFLVNQYRKEKGLEALRFSDIAYEHASDHTDYMISKGRLSHDNFSARASKISSSANARHVGENVARNHYKAEDVLEVWINSPNHHTTMVDIFTHTAISVKKNTDGMLYYTQLFYR